MCIINEQYFLIQTSYKNYAMVSTDCCKLYERIIHSHLYPNNFLVKFYKRYMILDSLDTEYIETWFSN